MSTFDETLDAMLNELWWPLPWKGGVAELCDENGREHLHPWARHVAISRKGLVIRWGGGLVYPADELELRCILLGPPPS